MIAVRSFIGICAFVFFLGAAGTARAECRGGAVSGNPACTGDYGSETTGLGLWIQQKVGDHDARVQQYNNLLESMKSARKYGDIAEFNRLGRSALAIFNEKSMRRWIDEVNFYHDADLAVAASEAGRYSDALAYVERLRARAPSREQKWLQKFVVLNTRNMLAKQAENENLTVAERVALYDKISRLDPKFYSPEGKAFIEWLRAYSVYLSGDKRTALQMYRRAIKMPGNDSQDRRDFIAYLEEELAPPKRVAVSTKLVAPTAEVAPTARGGIVVKEGTAMGQLKQATGGEPTLGQTFDGGGGTDTVYAVAAPFDDVVPIRVFSDRELERYNKSPAFVRANTDVESAAKLAREASGRRAQLAKQKTAATDSQKRQEIQIEIQRTEQEIVNRKGEMRAAEIARNEAMRVVDGHYIMVDQ